MKKSITGVGLPQNLRLRFWLHDAAIKEGKRFTVKQKALLEHFGRVMSEAQMPTPGADNVFGVDDGIRSQHSGNGLKRREIHPVSRCTLIVERNLSDRLRFN